jgi:D-arabinose 1-dehydrogenase-like Zn-dependent alcohol dehydrogenase
MRSMQIVAFGEALEEHELEEPAPPQGSEVLLKVSACGVCHSDVHLWQGFYDLGDGERIDIAARFPLPHTLGHEIVGDVVAVGPEGGRLAVGGRRLVHPWIGCGECEDCIDGNENLCPKPRFIGTHRAGGYAEYVKVPHPRYLLDAAAIPVEEACLYACSGLTSYAALKKVLPLDKRRRVLIIGAGGLGLMAISVARAMCENQIIVADIDPKKLEAARAAGADAVIDSGAEDAEREILEASGGGVGAAIDFVGAPATARFGLESLRRGGTLVVVGLFGGKLSISLPLLPMRAKRIVGSFVGTLDEMHEMIALVRRGRVAPVPVESRPLDQASRALADLRDGDVTGRIVLRL